MSAWDGLDPNAPLESLQDQSVAEDEDRAKEKVQGIRSSVEQQSSMSARVKRELSASAHVEAGGEDLIAELKSKNSIFDLYDKLIGGKTARQWGTRPDGNLASCPMPNHDDRNPSASFKEDGVWLCFSCEAGGDAIDLYAIAQGFQVPNYRSDPAEFRECLENACAMEGIEFDEREDDDLDDDDFDAINREAIEKRDRGELEIEIPEDALEDAEEIAQQGRVRLELHPKDGFPLAREDSFLGEWMSAHADAMERSPYEYHFFCGLVALGLTVGRSLRLDDPQGDVYGNVGIVLYGHTGARKSSAINNLTDLLEDAAPHDPDDHDCVGIRPLSSPASGEALIEQMRRVDKAGNDQEDGDPVRSVLALDELEGLMKLMNRQGSTLQDAVMQFLDGRGVVSVMSKGAGNRRVESGMLSFVTATQPKAVEGFLGQGSVDNGLLNRFMFVYGEPSPRHVDAEKVSVKSSASRLRAIQAWAERAEVITMDREVRQQLVDVAETIIDPIIEATQNQLLNRIELHHKRLAFLFAVNEMSDTLKPRHVDMATHLVETFIVPTFTAADEDLDRKVLPEVMRGIKEYVGARYGAGEVDKLTRGRIRSDVRVCRRNPDVVDRAFKLLLEEQEIAEVKVTALGGRKRILPYDEFLNLAYNKEK